jgi:hypothetical protein
MLYSVLKDFAGPLATIVAAVAAVCITAYFSRQNVAISKEQIRQSRFDRRLEVYLSAIEFYNDLIGWKGTEEQQKARHRFFIALHASYFLFDGDVAIETILAELHTMSVAIIGYKEHSAELSADKQLALRLFEETNQRLLVHFPGQMNALKTAMRPYLDLSISPVQRG